MKISQLPLLANPIGTETLPVVSGGQTKRAQLSALVAAASGGSAGGGSYGGFARMDVDAATLTLDPSHAAYRLVFRNACAVTVPADLPVDFECQWAQMGIGPVSFVPGAGMTIVSDNGGMASAARYAMGTLWVDDEGHAVLAGGI